MNNKLHIVLSVPVLAMLETLNVNVPQLEGAVNSALGELKGNDPTVKIGTAKIKKASETKPAEFKVGTTEKQEFIGASNTPLKFFLWNQKIEAACAVAEFESVSLPDAFDAWVMKFKSKSEQKAA